MKAVWFDRHGGPDVLQYGDVAEPSLGHGEVLIRVKACGVNYNDLWARRGMPGMTVPLPHISGTDTVGVVEQLGPGVTGVQPGDRVIVHPVLSCRSCVECTAGREWFCRNAKVWGFETGPLAGGYAELAVLPATNVMPMPASLSFEAAATLTGCGGTAWRMLATRAQLRPDDFVLIWGAGSGVGAYAVQIARLFGARAIAVASSPERLAYAVSLGAEYVIDRTSQDVEAEVRRITEKRGVDVVLEHSGRASWPSSIRALRRGGTLVTCGATTGHMAETDLRYVWTRQLNVLGSHLATKAEDAEFLSLIGRGRISPLRHELFAMSEVGRAQELLETGAVSGKLVISTS